jgi:hypothetical protein
MATAERDTAMGVQQQIEEYIAAQPASKADEMRKLHRLIHDISPDSRLWFLDGKDESGKIVSNPSIGYGALEIRYANGTAREFYRLGLSANTMGISLYVMGLEDRKYLSQSYGHRLGKANVTGYCVKFKTLSDLDEAVLKEMLRVGLSDRSQMV